MSEQSMRDAFEAHWARVRGPKKAERELHRHRLQPQCYVADNANRHWVTWQAAAKTPVSDVGDAADAIEALQAANEAFGKRQEWWNEKMLKLEQERDALAAKLVPLTYEGMSHLAAITPCRSDETMHTYGVRVGRAVEAAHGIQAKGGQQ